jgi:CheY-like chemotaxis protein
MNEFNTSGIKRIFVAEGDSDFFYFFNSAILSVSKSVNVLRTADGVMLLSLIESCVKPDIIFLDLNMPFKDGICCLQAIRSNEKTKLTKVVMFSLSDNAKDVDACYNNDADFYFTKPTSFLSLVQQFKNLLMNEHFIKNIKPSRENFVVNDN